MTRPPTGQNLAKIQGLIPETMQVVARFVGDTELLRRCIPKSSSTGSRIRIWPEMLAGANDIPLGTLLQLGGVEAAIWGSNYSFSLQSRDDGLAEARLERPADVVHEDDFQITIGRSSGFEWGDDDRPTFVVSVQYLDSVTPAESSVVSAFVRGLDDQRLARLVDVALDGRRYRLPRYDALHAVRDHAIAFGARQSGLHWQLPVGRRVEETPTDIFETAAPAP